MHIQITFFHSSYNSDPDGKMMSKVPPIEDHTLMSDISDTACVVFRDDKFFDRWDDVRPIGSYMLDYQYNTEL